MDAIAFESYLHGLVDAGWSGNADIVRLGYVTWVSVWFGVVFPNLTTLWCSPQFRPYALKFIGLVEEELFHYFLPLFNYSLDCADEARMLMKKLGFHEF